MPAWLPAWKAPGASSGHHISAPLSWMEPREAGTPEEGREKGLWAASCQFQPWAAPPSLSHWVDQEFAVPIKLCPFTPPGSCSCCLRPLPGLSGSRGDLLRMAWLRLLWGTRAAGRARGSPAGPWCGLHIPATPWGWLRGELHKSLL